MALRGASNNLRILIVMKLFQHNGILCNRTVSNHKTCYIMACVMLSSFGIRAYRNLLRKFFSPDSYREAFNNSIFIIYHWAGAATLIGGLWKWEGCAA